MTQLLLTVAIPTYLRADRLGPALTRVLEQVRALTTIDDLAVVGEVLLVDNDAAGSAAPVADRFAAPDLRYVVEPVPGIVAARNRALDECEHRDVLVFIDDDEIPRPSWLRELVRTYLATRPAAVAGQVVSQYDRSTVEPWVAAGELFERAVWPTGTEVSVAATGNILLDLAQLRAKDVRFDKRLGMAGGEDSLMTSLLTKRGGRIVFCAESVADDPVVAERLTRDWLLHRALRAGSTNVHVAVLLAETTSQRVRAYATGFVGGVLRMATGGAQAVVGVLTGSLARQARGQRALWRGRGMARAATGRAIEGYRRD